MWSSSSPMSSSSSAVSWPVARAWSRRTWASARSSSQPSCASSGAGGPGSGSSSRCQPSRHCCARSDRARSAQAGQLSRRGCDRHGIRTWSTCAGVGVGAAELDRAGAAAAGFGELADGVAGQRHRQPFGAGGPVTGITAGIAVPSARSSAACQVTDQPHSPQSWSVSVPSGSSVAVRPVPQTGHGSSVRQAVGAVMPRLLPGLATARGRTGVGAYWRHMAVMSSSDTQAARTRTGSGSASSRT